MMNISRNLSVVSRKDNKSTEKLSTGYRINRAADDAAGLTISEKMRSQIRGLDKASENAQTGISLIQTAEGALEEVQSMVHRIKELSVKAANGTNTRGDTEAIQMEVDELIEEIDRVASSTEFNTLNLLDGSLGGGNAFGMRRDKSILNVAGESGALTGTTFAFSTSQVPSGGNTTVGYEKLADDLETQIVPQIVNNILNKYSAFSSLNGSTIGMGLRLYRQSSNTLAYVSAGYQEGGTGGVDGSKEYQLGVNLNHLQFQPNGDLTANSREELEATIAHEMIHAFMAESTTNGMMGSDPFPLWFVEGMAQTASGPGEWTSPLSSVSSDSAISNFLSKIGPGYGKGDAVANYGTGYLANMYMGYMAGSGATLESRVTDGLNKIMTTIKGGTSLNDAIVQHTKYNGLADFSNNLRNDHDAFDFVRDLLGATGAGRGGLITGDLTDTDLANNGNLAGINVFKLDKNHEKIKNIYSGGNVILSGGGANSTQPPPGTSSSHGLRGGDLGELILQVGAKAGQTLKISIAGSDSDHLGLRNLSVTTQESAGWAMESCDKALERISENRSRMGASQNRLEHIIKNLDNTMENTQAAESLIRDVDIAKEMVSHSSNNIIMQLTQSLLAQANQSSQNVLSILS